MRQLELCHMDGWVGRGVLNRFDGRYALFPLALQQSLTVHHTRLDELLWHAAGRCKDKSISSVERPYRAVLSRDTEAAD